MDLNPWGPNESAATILAEEAWLQGAFAAKIFYGMILVLSWQCFFMLLKQTTRSTCRKKIPFLLIVFAIFMFGSFHSGYNMKSMQLAFIENRNYPGGPSAYKNDSHSDTLGNIAYILMQWLCDGLLVWRFVMICKGCIFMSTWIIATPPIIVLLGSSATGILLIRQLSVASPLEKIGVDWTVPYFSISLGLNILLTIAIVTRLLRFRYHISSVLGSTHGSPYTSIASIVVESAALYSSFSIFFIVPFARNSSISAIPLQLIGQVQGFATLLIVHRVASGIAWSSNTQSILSTHMEFRVFQTAKFPPSESVAVSGSNTVASSNTPGTRCAIEKGSVLTGVCVTKDIETVVVSVLDASQKDAYDRV